VVQTVLGNLEHNEVSVMQAEKKENPKVEIFRKERTLVCALSLPKEMHDRLIGFLARRAGLDDRRGSC